MSVLHIKVGIIIPAYNIGEYIFRALESCINQTYKNIEILVVDDGSSDNTYDIAKSYSDKDDRIKLYHQKNAGVSSARNSALEMCTSDYVLFLDSDDWLETDTVEKLVQRIGDNYSEQSLISSGCYYNRIGENGDIFRIISDNENKYIIMSSEEVLMYVGKRKFNLRSSCYKLFSMKVISENRLRFDCNIRHGEDGLFVFEYLKVVEKFIYFPDPLWNILRRSGSASRSPYNSSKMSAVAAVERMLEYDNNKALSRELRKFYVQRILVVLSDALIADPMPKNDIVNLRKKLRRQFWIYMVLQKKLKLKLIYILEVFGPQTLAAYLLKKRKNRLRKEGYR